MADEIKPEENMSVIIQRVVDQEDLERLKSFTSLLNTFNYAVQVQSCRAHWEPDDFRAFCTALNAMDSIGLNDKLPVASNVEAMQIPHNRYAK